jgi:sugar phosphate permease
MLGTVPSLSGALSVLAIGFISDRIGHRGPLLVFFLLVSVVCMIGLALLASDPDRPLAPVLILVAGSSVLSGPYSLLTACTMDCCGTLDDPGLLPLFQGLQDGSGYLFAATSGVLVGGSLEEKGWENAMFKIAGFGVMAMGAAGAYWREERRREGGGGVTYEGRAKMSC